MAIHPFAPKWISFFLHKSSEKANLVLTLEEWEEIKKNRAEMQSTAMHTRDA
jgi:hypothetical protein